MPPKNDWLKPLILYTIYTSTINSKISLQWYISSLHNNFILPTKFNKADSQREEYIKLEEGVKVYTHIVHVQLYLPQETTAFKASCVNYYV